MKLIITTLIFSFLISNSLTGQTNIGANIDSDLSVANLRAYSVGTFDNRETAFIGSTLLWENWMYGTILLEGNTKFSEKEYHLNYDALSNLLYVRIGSSVYDLLLLKVNSLKIVDILNGTDTTYKVLKDENSDLALYEILYANENIELVKRTDVQVVKGNYNTALDAGDVRSQLKKSDAFCLLKDDQLFELPKKRKKLVNKYIKTKEIKDIVTFFDENRVNLKDEEEIHSALIDFNKNK